MIPTTTVMGSYTTARPGPLWTIPGPYPGSYGTEPVGMSGTNIVGSYLDATNNTHGFLYNGSTWTNLDDPQAAPGGVGGTYAQAIDGPNIVGFYGDSNGCAHGFLLSGTNWTILDDPLAATNPGQGTYPRGISGTNIVGQYLDVSNNWHGFLFNGSTYITLDDPRAPTHNGNTSLSGISGTNIVGAYWGSSYQGCLLSLRGTPGPTGRPWTIRWVCKGPTRKAFQAPTWWGSTMIPAATPTGFSPRQYRS